MRILGVLVWIVSLLTIGASLLPAVKSARWWVRVWDYPRPQLAIALGGLAVVQVLVLPRAGAALALTLATAAALAWQLFRIAPYTRLWRRQVAPAEREDPARTIGILIANVLQDNRDVASFLARIDGCDPDVVLAVETNGWWDAQIATLVERYPYNLRHPLENTYGMHLFSRLELVDVRLQERVEPGVPSIAARVRLRSGELVTLHCVHPEPPQVGNDVDERDAELLLVAREAARDGRPTIVCGDLNDVAWSYTHATWCHVPVVASPSTVCERCATDTGNCAQFSGISLSSAGFTQTS